MSSTTTYYEGVNGRLTPCKYVSTCLQDPRCIHVKVTATRYGYDRGEYLEIPKMFFVKKLRKLNASWIVQVVVNQ